MDNSFLLNSKMVDLEDYEWIEWVRVQKHIYKNITLLKNNIIFYVNDVLRRIPEMNYKVDLIEELYNK